MTITIYCYYLKVVHASHDLLSKHLICIFVNHSYTLDTTVTNLDTTVTNLDTTVTNLDTTVANLDTTVTNLDTTVTNLDTTVTNLDTTVTNLDREYVRGMKVWVCVGYIHWIQL